MFFRLLLTWCTNKRYLQRSTLFKISMNAAVFQAVSPFCVFDERRTRCKSRDTCHDIPILNETSKPPVNKTHFFNIIHLLLNCLKWYLPQYTWTHYASIEHNTVWFNQNVHLCVTIEYLYLFCTWHTNAKCFSPCVYSYFHRQLLDNFILSQKCQRLGCMSIK